LDLLPPATLQGLVYAHDQWLPFRDESLDKQIQKDAARLPARPHGAAQHPVVAMEAPLPAETRRAQGGTDGAFSRGEDRASGKNLHVLEDSPGEKWREGSQNPYHLVR
jgi:hypothetical protein